MTTTRITKAEAARIERQEAQDELRTRLQPGDVVNVIQRSVSASGMMRRLSLFIGDENITHLAATAMGEKLDHNSGFAAIKVNGCGMDMHFATVYNLARAIWPNGHPCTGHDADEWDDFRDRLMTRCPSNDHVNDKAWDYSTGRIHNDGGYALRHRTL